MALIPLSSMFAIRIAILYLSRKNWMKSFRKNLTTCKRRHVKMKMRWRPIGRLMVRSCLLNLTVLGNNGGGCLPVAGFRWSSRVASSTMLSCKCVFPLNFCGRTNIRAMRSIKSMCSSSRCLGNIFTCKSPRFTCAPISRAMTLRHRITRKLL